MRDTLGLLVFTDLDGTLIDHDTYQWDAARPALAALSVARAGVVLASSKTSSEIKALRGDLDLRDWPAIVENGAGLLPAGAAPAKDTNDYAAIRVALEGLPPGLRRHFTGFGDLSPEALRQITGLSREAAELAKDRAYSEPGLWAGTASELARFQSLLQAEGITMREGGRFLTLSFGRNKSDQMAALVQTYRPRYTVALGDAPNDVEMLEAADFGFIVANPKRSPLPKLEGEAEGRIQRTAQAGPLGWNMAILDLLERLDLQKD
ncbi:HAD-IIB family hydrolase [Roseobacter weihaiensis]|uniref:HAD-IIB family hydrolase n=1 Tax=Roseobacter weihaiensis TaxID=2763262 RepID=UPI001D0B1135|nr:HAD-IIB family hydrolase [Roseobacter sp. H9]